MQTFTQDFPADIRGAAIGNADGIRTAHNSFAPPEAALSDNETRTADADDELYHFISFIYSAGSVWELDGLQAGPIRCCDCPHVRLHPPLVAANPSAAADISTHTWCQLWVRLCNASECRPFWSHD